MYLARSCQHTPSGASHLFPCLEVRQQGCIHQLRARRSCPFKFQAFAFVRVAVKEFKSLRLRPPTPEAYGKTADFGTLCIPGSSQRLDPSAALLSSSDRSRLAALNFHADSLSCPLTQLYIPGVPGGCKGGPGGPATSRKHEK